MSYFDDNEDRIIYGAGRRVRHPKPEPETVSCKFCGSTDVYWMQVLTKREAEFLAKNGTPKALQLASAKLYNTVGGEHNCQRRGPADADEFEVVE